MTLCNDWFYFVTELILLTEWLWWRFNELFYWLTDWLSDWVILTDWMTLLNGGLSWLTLLTSGWLYWRCTDWLTLWNDLIFWLTDWLSDWEIFITRWRYWMSGFPDEPYWLIGCIDWLTLLTDWLGILTDWSKKRRRLESELGSPIILILIHTFWKCECHYILKHLRTYTPAVHKAFV